MIDCIFNRIKQLLYHIRRFGRVKQAIRYGISPVNRQDFQQRVNILPLCNRHENAVVVFALVERVHVVKVKIYYLNLGWFFQISSLSMST